MDSGPAMYVMPTALPSQAPKLTGGWIPISLTVSAPDDGGAPTATVTIDSATWTAALMGPGSAFTSSVTLRLGAVFVDQSPTGWSANFDNVVVYAQ